MEFTVPDTLVLKIVEHDLDLHRPDTTLYVLYDKRENKFIIRGKRSDTPNSNSCTYSFECDFAVDLANFVEFLIDRKNKISYVLYNYDNLPNTSNDITFDFLHNYDNDEYELSGYDDKKLRRKELLRNLRMLRNVYNNY